MDEKEREQFRQLCKTTGISVANVLRSWIQQALKDQHIEVNVPPDARTLQLQNVSNAAASNNYDDTVIKGMLERIDKVERIFNYIDEDELEFMKNEILNDKFGLYETVLELELSFRNQENLLLGKRLGN